MRSGSSSKLTLFYGYLLAINLHDIKTTEVNAISSFSQVTVCV